jgi:hypothetical protein
MSKTEIYIGIHSEISIAGRRSRSESGGCVRVFLNVKWGDGVFSRRGFRVV